jgi:hypothetical protein
LRNSVTNDASAVLDALLHKAITENNRELLDTIVYTAACHFEHDDGEEITNRICDELLDPNRPDDFFEFEPLCDALALDESPGKNETAQFQMCGGNGAC